MQRAHQSSDEPINVRPDKQWKQLKELAMKPDYAVSSWFVSVKLTYHYYFLD